MFGRPSEHFKGYLIIRAGRDPEEQKRIIADYFRDYQKRDERRPKSKTKYGSTRTEEEIAEERRTANAERMRIFRQVQRAAEEKGLKQKIIRYADYIPKTFRQRQSENATSVEMTERLASEAAQSRQKYRHVAATGKPPCIPNQLMAAAAGGTGSSAPDAPSIPLSRGRDEPDRNVAANDLRGSPLPCGKGIVSHELHPTTCGDGGFRDNSSALLSSGAFTLHVLQQLPPPPPGTQPPSRVECHPSTSRFQHLLLLPVAAAGSPREPAGAVSAATGLGLPPLLAGGSSLSPPVYVFGQYSASMALLKSCVAYQQQQQQMFVSNKPVQQPPPPPGSSACTTALKVQQVVLSGQPIVCGSSGGGGGCSPVQLDESVDTADYAAEAAQRQHPCDFCGDEFALLSDLEMHQKSEHPSWTACTFNLYSYINAFGRQHPCDFCGDEFALLSDLEMHQQSEHPGWTTWALQEH